MGKTGNVQGTMTGQRKILAALFLTGITLVALEDVIRLDKSAIMLVLWQLTLEIGFHMGVPQVIHFRSGFSMK